MKATAKKTNRCEGYYRGFTYKVLQLEVYALRIIGPRRKSIVVPRRDFDIETEPTDPPELTEKL